MPDEPSATPPVLALSRPVSGPAALARPAAVYLARLAAGSRPAMLTSLRAIVDAVQPGADVASFPWGALRYEHAQAIRAAVSARGAPATANKHLAALRGVLREAWKLGHMTAEELERALSFDKVRGNSPMAGRMLAPEEVSLLLDTCDDNPRGRRDAAILAVAVFGGLRRTEISRLDRASVQADRLKVHGKGNKHREVPFTAAARVYLDRWLEARGHAPGPLFVSMRRGERFRQPGAVLPPPKWPPSFTGGEPPGPPPAATVVEASRLSPNGVWLVIATAVERVALEHATPHDFRRTFVSLLLDKHDAKTVQDMAGHARVDTTMRYDRRGDERKVAAAATIGEIMRTAVQTCACGSTYTREDNVFRWRCARCDAEVSVLRRQKHDARLTLQRVEQANARARAKGSPATLTLPRWITTVRAFDGLCAYCGKAEFDVIEHAVQIPRGGTTASNCLPACNICNNNKGPRTLAEWASTPRHHAALAYLAAQES